MAALKMLPHVELDDSKAKTKGCESTGAAHLRGRQVTNLGSVCALQSNFNLAPDNVTKLDLQSLLLESTKKEDAIQNRRCLCERWAGTTV